jgi:hypothetical protein
MASDEQLSPEEKLLKVIQAKDGQKGAEPGDSRQSSSPAGSGERRIKLAPEQASTPASSKAQHVSEPLLAAEQTPAEGTIAAASEPVEETSAPAPVVPSGSMSDCSWLRYVSRGLGTLTAAVVLLIAYECWSNVESLRYSKSRVASRKPLPAFAEKADLPPLDSLVTLFEKGPVGKGPVIRNLGDAAEVSGKSTDSGQGTLTGWREYAQKNLDLIGMASGKSAAVREAIVVDRQQKRMHIVKTGDKISVENRQVEIVSIGDAEVTLSDGGSKLTIK